MSTPTPEKSRRQGLLKEAWFDRDLSWLEFNRRVLSEALDDRTPLLERLKFLGIFTSNLDEFFMKRVGAMRTRAYASGNAASIEQFHAHMLRLRKALFPMLLEQAACFARLRPLLAEQGVRLAEWQELSDSQREEASRYFDAHVSPALTPLSLDPSHPFPFMSNLSTSWGFMLYDPVTADRVHVRVKVPPTIPQWLPLHSDVADGERCFVALQDLVRHNAHKMFPGVTIEAATLFRVSRNADIAIEEDSDNSIREMIEEQVRQRRFQPVVRLEFGGSLLSDVRDGLMSHFELRDSDVYELPGPLDYTTLSAIASLPMPALRDPPWSPMPPLGLDDDTDLFALIRAGDVLVHHPYESFDASVERFIRDAANDPNTTTIKMTVYRLGDDTPFVRSLITAAENGKQVACLVELKARFDEERNLHWANELQKAGDHVIYGMRGLKTHTKLALVVRREADGLRSYAHIGTGNYHVKTARMYTDFGLFTCDPVITRDVVNLFHHLTGYSRAPTFEKLLVAPINMRERLIELIGREADNARAGRPARIVAKMNQVEDLPVCEALSEASQAGVQIDLIVRGFCCLRPGVPGWSENVRVRSIIGRFLEHGRVFCFANGQADLLDGDFYIGSADWMDRNLSRRVEAVAPVENRYLRERVWEVLQVQLADQRNAWQMQPDGSYVRIAADKDAPEVARDGTHVTLMKRSRARLRR
ncbi:MAG: polyphosphate kinase 1 [Gammaproteobacteria bacterium]|nr:polyphosphate kinase 1 [Gammaproteobacteria bacterium]